MTQTLMQALRLTASNESKPCLALTTLPKPSLPPSTVLVKILAAGINPSDVLNSNGGFHHTTFPRVPGRDYAGIVTGGPVEFVGQEVYGTSGSSLGFSVDGTHAEYCVEPSESITLKPSNLSFAQAAAVGVPFTTAALVLRRAMLQPTDVVLVLGASGAVGSAACQLARNRGCRVLTAARRDTADVNLVTDPELKAVKSLTDGKGADVVVDTAGSPILMNNALMCLAPRGRLAYIAAPRKGSTDFRFDMKHVYREEKIIIGCNSVLAGLPETATDLETMTAGFENGSLQAPKETDLETIRIEDAIDVYKMMGNCQGKKFVIVF
jgi:NADPH2:quinone reductase